ncbi:hypothetical protein ACUU3K_001599 [Campylobacter upsaliensis]
MNLKAKFGKVVRLWAGRAFRFLLQTRGVFATHRKVANAIA